MKKISYPKDKITLHSEYYKLFDATKIKAINAHLKNISFKRKPLTFEIILTLTIKELIALSKFIEKYIQQDTRRGGKFKKLFNYKSLQPRLANFFMNKSKIDLKVCHYCSIDFINAFVDFPDYRNGLDFLNHADKYDLMLVKGIDGSKADKIIAGRNYQNYSKVVVTPKTLKIIKSIPFSNSHNQFTLDHLLPQSKYPYFSLCLYNLVPSCYSCNSKFKKVIEFDIDSNLTYISPTSEDHDFNGCFSFKIFYSKRFMDLKNEQDFELRKDIKGQEKHVQKYLKMFKIMGRYAAHKQQILELIEKMKNYPESKIQELFRQTGLPKSEIRKMIFGKDLYEAEFDGQAFVKFRRDIAKNINLKGVRIQ